MACAKSSVDGNAKAVSFSSSSVSGAVNFASGKIHGFSNQDDEDLVKIVSNYEMLWKLNHPDYKNNIKKDVIWNKIGLHLNKSGKQCKARWRSIRDNFKRHKKTDATGTGQPAKKKRATYWDQLRFLDDADDRQGSTNTLEPGCPTNDGFFIEHEWNYLPSDDDSFGYEEPLSPSDINPPSSSKSVQQSKSTTEEQSTPKINKKRKGSNRLIDLLEGLTENQSNLVKAIEKMATQQVVNSEEDEIDVFMRSMTLTIKKFTPAEQSEAKRKIFHVVNELEDRHHVVLIQ